MSSLLPSGCILIGMSCFCFFIFVPSGTLCSISHAHTHTRTHVHAVSHDFRSRCLPQSVSVNLILHTFVRTQKRRKSSLAFALYATLLLFLFPSSFFLACLALLGSSLTLPPLLLLMHIHICVPCVYLPKRGLCDFWLRANFE